MHRTEHLHDHDRLSNHQCHAIRSGRRFDRRSPHHNDPWGVRIDVTEAVRKLVAKGETDLQVTLVPISPSGNGAALRMNAVSLAFHD